MTRFATVENPCPLGAGPEEICYQNSQGDDCQAGFACPPATTGYTTRDYPCEPGYYCAPRTVPREMRNLGREQAGFLIHRMRIGPVAERFEIGFRPVSPPPCTVQMSYVSLPHSTVMSDLPSRVLSDLRSVISGHAQS